MDALKSLIQPLVGGAGGSSVVDGMKLVVLGGTVETARRVSSSACQWRASARTGAKWGCAVDLRTCVCAGIGGIPIDIAHARAVANCTFDSELHAPWGNRQRRMVLAPREFRSHPPNFLPSFFLTAHFSEEDTPYDWLMLWLSRRPEWQRSREFETTTRTSGPGGDEKSEWDIEEEEEDRGWGDDDGEGRPKTRVVFQPTFDTTHTIYYRGHWLRVRRGRNQDGYEVLSISVVARSNTILKQLVLQAKKEYEAEAIHRIQIYFADAHGSWRWTDSRHKRPMASIVLNPGVKEMLLDDTRDFLKSEKWYADRGIPFRRGYLLHGVPGSGKSSLIHALAGQLQLDIYVVSLSASWISDSTLTTLMGRVPARCVVLLEDLDAAFTRSVTRDDNQEDGDEKKKEGEGDNNNHNNNSSGGMGRRRRRDQLSDVNTLSLSGLLNALDGVAAAEGRLLFATTNHLERLDPALSRPGRMDVWVEFRNASKWQAEALFRNFFPSEEDEEELAAVNLKVEVESSNPSPTSTRGGRAFAPTPPPPATQPSTSLWSLSSSITSSASSLLSSAPATPSTAPTSFLPTPVPSSASVPFPSSSKSSSTSSNANSAQQGLVLDKEQFGASNTAYLPPPPEDNVLKNRHSAAPLDKKTLAVLAKRFADGVPEEEFSVAALQGYLLKYKAQPDAAAKGIEEWVIKEREMRERLKREKEAREVREKAMREKRRKEALAKAQEKKALEKKEEELEKVKQRLAEKEKEEELEKMRLQLKEKEREAEEKKKAQAASGEAPAAEETKDETAVLETKDDGDDSDEENVAPQSADSETSSAWGEV
ncbi:hypothetical protein BDQ12DRAFT_594079 [Crucibulum laeve]|uniref:P-loop containing nucleoside triphosphate hydrolase protein n=1 Tax=Crucibulum laeve TaxID=68775 RepID=A0A5C3MRU2_9AGAR|nr:hypothetical protein BDQ12DRAFT_594079 [Crucibulum laeve]